MKLVAGMFFIGLLLPVLSAWAQSPSDEREEAAAAESRQRVEFMEQALERAVSQGVRIVERQLPALAPGLVFFAGPIQARGFALDGYGWFFDVEYPVVRRSILWSMGARRQFDVTMSDALEDLQRRLEAMQEGPTRVALGQALRELEADVRLTSPVAPVAQEASPDSDDVESRSPFGAVPGDPQQLYLSALTATLTDTLLTYGAAMPLDDDEWLTVAARDGRRSYGRGGSTIPSSLVFRIRGRDLAAVRSGELSPEEARQRVEIQ